MSSVVRGTRSAPSRTSTSTQARAVRSGFAVKGGIFGTRSRLVPIGDARLDGNGVIVTETKDTIKDAPDVTLDSEVSEAEERELYEYHDLTFESTGNRRFSRL